MREVNAVVGEVVAADGSQVKVRIRRHTACGRAHRCPLDAGLRFVQGAEYLEVEAKTSEALRPGETVLVTTESRYVTRSWLLGFGLPLVGALAGAAAGARIAGTDLGAAAMPAWRAAGGPCGTSPGIWLPPPSTRPATRQIPVPPGARFRVPTASSPSR